MIPERYARQQLVEHGRYKDRGKQDQCELERCQVEPSSRLA